MCVNLIGRLYIFFFFFKQETAYEMRISDWSSDVCSSDLMVARPVAWNGGKSCVNPATQRLVEIGLPGNAFPLPDCELRENGIFDAVEPLHAQNARIQQLLA